MQHFERLLEKTRDRDREEALIWGNQFLTFRDVEEKRLQWLDLLGMRGVESGQVVGLRADYSPEVISLFLALLSNRNIVALIPRSTKIEETLLVDCQAELLFRLETDGFCHCEKRPSTAGHPLLRVLRDAGSAGFIVFSSGSTGRPKAVLHDLERFQTKFLAADKK